MPNTFTATQTMNSNTPIFIKKTNDTTNANIDFKKSNNEVVASFGHSVNGGVLGDAYFGNGSGSIRIRYIDATKAKSSLHFYDGSGFLEVLHTGNAGSYNGIGSIYTKIASNYISAGTVVEGSRLSDEKSGSWRASRTSNIVISGTTIYVQSFMRIS